MNAYFKSWGTVNGKVVRDIELVDSEKKGKSIIRGHIGKKPVRMTLKRRLGLAFPMNVLKTFSKTVKRMRRRGSARRK